MKRYKLETHSKKILADTLSPVSVYLKIRDKFPNSILLESSDYHGNENSFSYICFNPIANIKIQSKSLTKSYPDQTKKKYEIDYKDVTSEIQKFTEEFEVNEDKSYKFIYNGLFGYTSYDAVKYFESIEISNKKNSLKIPEIQYSVFQNIIAINHFKNEAFIFAHCYKNKNNIEAIHQLITKDRYATFNFETSGEIYSNLTDEEFIEMVNIAKKTLSKRRCISIGIIT